MEKQAAVVSSPIPLPITILLVTDFVFLFQARLYITPDQKRRVLGHMFQRSPLNTWELKMIN